MITSLKKSTSRDEQTSHGCTSLSSHYLLLHMYKSTRNYGGALYSNFQPCLTSSLTLRHTLPGLGLGACARQRAPKSFVQDGGHRYHTNLHGGGVPCRHLAYCISLIRWRTPHSQDYQLTKLLFPQS